MTVATLVIDVQSALCTGEFAGFDCAGVIKRINGVTQTSREAGLPVLFIQHESSEEPLVRGSKGWQFADGLNVDVKDTVVHKTAADSFHQTDLKAVLEQRGVTELIVCGMQSDFCVDTTIRRALALGYPVTLVSDAHTTVDNGVLTAEQISAHHNTTLANLSSFGPRVKTMPAADIAIKA